MEAEIERLERKTRLLQQQLSDYRWLFNQAKSPMMLLDKQGIFLDYNKAYFQLLGYQQKTGLREFHPKDISPVFQPDGKDSELKANEMIEMAFKHGKHQFEWLHRRPDGKTFLSLVTLESIRFNGRPAVLAEMKDISDIRKLEQLVAERTEQLEIRNKELEQLSSLDPLTGLYNRRKLDAVIAYAFEHALETHHPICVMFFDIDHFKAYNDNYGHSSGDKTLEMVAKRLKAITVKYTEYLARYGGEEFILLRLDAKPEDLEPMAKDLVESIREMMITHQYSSVEPFITISVGGVLAIPDEQDASLRTLIDKADEMLYRAKLSGRNRYELHIEEQERDDVEIESF